MTPTSYVLGIVSALLVLWVVLSRLRSRRLRERHAVWWTLGGVVALVAGVFPGALEWAAGLMGIAVPINLVFFVSIAVLFMVGVQHAAELTKLESKTQTLAERVALLELEVRRLRDTSHDVS